MSEPRNSSSSEEYKRGVIKHYVKSDRDDTTKTVFFYPITDVESVYLRTPIRHSNGSKTKYAPKTPLQVVGYGEDYIDPETGNRLRDADNLYTILQMVNENFEKFGDASFRNITQLNQSGDPDNSTLPTKRYMESLLFGYGRNSDGSVYSAQKPANGTIWANINTNTANISILTKRVGELGDKPKTFPHTSIYDALTTHHSDITANASNISNILTLIGPNPSQSPDTSIMTRLSDAEINITNLGTNKADKPTSSGTKMTIENYCRNLYYSKEEINNYFYKTNTVPSDVTTVTNTSSIWGAINARATKTDVNNSITNLTTEVEKKANANTSDAYCTAFSYCLYGKIDLSTLENTGGWLPKFGEENGYIRQTHSVGTGPVLSDDGTRYSMFEILEGHSESHPDPTFVNVAPDISPNAQEHILSIMSGGCFCVITEQYLPSTYIYFVGTNGTCIHLYSTLYGFGSDVIRNQSGQIINEHRLRSVQTDGPYQHKFEFINHEGVKKITTVFEFCKFEALYECAKNHLVYQKIILKILSCYVEELGGSVEGGIYNIFS